jgi:hypothetical protein
MKFLEWWREWNPWEWNFVAQPDDNDPLFKVSYGMVYQLVNGKFLAVAFGLKANEQGFKIIHKVHATKESAMNWIERDFIKRGKWERKQ